MEINDRVAIITGGGGGVRPGGGPPGGGGGGLSPGGGGGLGRRAAGGWRPEGARHVVVADRNGKAARAVGEEIGCLGVELDVTDEAAVVALVGKVDDEIGPIDIFFSN